MEQLLQALLDYQDFAGHPGLERQLEAVRRRYLGEELPDAWLDVAAAGDPADLPSPFQERRDHGSD